MRLRGGIAECFFGVLVCAAKWPIGRLRGDPPRVGVGSKSPGINQKKKKGRTADEPKDGSNMLRIPENLHIVFSASRSGVSDIWRCWLRRSGHYRRGGG